MDLQAAFRARLKAVSGLNTPTAGRIEWGGVSSGSPRPYLRLTKVFPGREWTHDGPNPLVNPRVQIDIIAETGAKAGVLAAVLQAEMERLDEVTVGGWTFVPPALLQIENGPEPEDLNGGGQAYRILHDYSFFAHPQD